jgi:hypothetical protein
LNYIFGLLGLSGGILCAIGDMFLDLKGADNKKMGKYKFMDSNWINMSEWRFRASILLAAAGVPLYFLGATSMARQLADIDLYFGLTFWIVMMIGSIGGFFIHAFLCCIPIIYKSMIKQAGFELTEEVINRIYHAIKIPFFVMFILLVGVSSIMLFIAKAAGYLSIPSITLILTPLPLLMIGVLLRFIKGKWFHDLPGIVMPSMGLGMIGLLAAINTFLA